LVPEALMMNPASSTFSPVRTLRRVENIDQGRRFLDGDEGRTETGVGENQVAPSGVNFSIVAVWLLTA
jgi:hypothetical protein